MQCHLAAGTTGLPYNILQDRGQAGVPGLHGIHIAMFMPFNNVSNLCPEYLKIYY